MARLFEWPHNVWGKVHAEVRPKIVRASKRPKGPKGTETSRPQP